MNTISNVEDSIGNDNLHERTSRVAIASFIAMVIAILTFTLICFLRMVGVHPLIPTLLGGLSSGGALVLGIIAATVVARQREELKGLEYAVLAIVLSVGPFFISMFMLYGDQANVKPDPLYNLKTLGKALIAYAEENDGLLPDANRWCDLLTKHNRKIKRDNFIRPEAAKYDLRGDCHFAFNENLSGLRLADVPDDVVLLFMSEGRWNLNGSAELLSRAPLGRPSVPGVIRHVLLKNGTIEMYVYKHDKLWKVGESGLLEEQPRWKP